MQKSHEKEMQDFKTEMLGSKREDELKHTIGALETAIKDNKERADGMAGQLSSEVGKIATETTHAFEKMMLQRGHEEKENELKKKIEDGERSRNLTNEQYFSEKGERLFGKALETAGGFAKGVQETLKPSVESVASIDRGKIAMDLASKGFSPEQVTTVLEGKTMMPRNPGLNSAAEYERLQKSIGPPEQQNTLAPETSRVKMNVGS